MKQARQNHYKDNCFLFLSFLDPCPLPLAILARINFTVHPFPGPAKLKTLLSRVLFRHFEVLSVLYAPSPLLPLLTLGTSTGLVLDLGHREATVLPVVEGVTVLKAWQALPLGGAAVEAALEAAVREKATVKDRNGTERKVQEMEGTVVHCAGQREKKNSPNAKHFKMFNTPPVSSF